MIKGGNLFAEENSGAVRRPRWLPLIVRTIYQGMSIAAVYIHYENVVRICRVRGGLDFLLKYDPVTIRRPTHPPGIPYGICSRVKDDRCDLDFVCPISIHHEDGKTAGGSLAHKRDLRTIRRPGGMIVNHGVVCETDLVRPVRIHDIYLAVTITVAGKCNLAVSAKRRRVARPCLVETARVRPAWTDCLPAG